jgi:D-3-phosphoglycerate dehydrogenase
MDLVSHGEFAMMKPTARVLNVARGGVYSEEALLQALDAGTIAGAGLDVFTTEPPQPDSAASKLARHPRVVATPHLGASTIEAQENVSLDVCAQVLTILSGGLPTSAVNAPLILPEEYRKLQPFVKLIEKMGSLYTQHYANAPSLRVSGKVFDLVYEGELASMSSTRPLFAALIKGLTSTISDSGGRDVNIVNASLIAREKGIIVNESHIRDSSTPYASLVTLRTTTTSSEWQGPGSAPHHSISGYVSGHTIHISRLDRFMTSFIPAGTLLILHNYDSPGKIGGVGSILGKRGVNIKFMNVASLDDKFRVERCEANANGAENGLDLDNGYRWNEALMILGVEGVVDRDVVQELRDGDGILNVSVVRL